MKVAILGASTTKFGELWNVSPRDLVSQVVKNTLDESDRSIKEVQGVFVGNMLSGILGQQEHIGAFFAEELGLTCAGMKIEGACSSGGLAMHTGIMAILSGLYETVLVVGVEKMTDYKPEEVASALMGAGSDGEREAGATFPALYAMMARAHMDAYGTTESDMAHVSVKNHFHASLNSNAQFPFTITVEQVLHSPKISSPLKLLDCSPISDGASAVLLSSNNSSTAKNHVYVEASSVATDALGLAQRKSLTSLQSTIFASKKAYSMAGVGPHDIDVAEVHDCFSIAEIIAMEDLGFCAVGAGGAYVSSGCTRLGKGSLAINTSGGLKACGHPVGATGVKQIVEVYQQLKGSAGKKQVREAKVGLTHNVGGSGATAVVHILKK